MEESLALPLSALPTRTDPEWVDLAAAIAAKGRADLARYQSIGEILQSHRKAQAIQEYLTHAIQDRAHKLAAANHLAELRLWQEREIGRWLASVETRGDGRPKETVSADTVCPPSLERLGVTRVESQRWQTMARLPEPKFEAHLATTKAAGRELTSFGVFREAKRCELAASADTPPFPSTAYRCLVIDPPWPVEKIIRDVRTVQSWALDYATMSLQEIEALPIPTLAEPDGCHVYLWVTHHFLPAGLGLFEAWGVRYQCSLTWGKNVGITPFSWMYDTEHVLFGRIGSLDLLRQGLRLLFQAPVVGHSVKPDVFYERVREASPGPRLEMFARQAHEGFEPWGAEAAIG